MSDDPQVFYFGKDAPSLKYVRLSPDGDDIPTFLENDVVCIIHPDTGMTIQVRWN